MVLKACLRVCEMMFTTVYTEVDLHEEFMTYRLQRRRYHRDKTLDIAAIRGGAPSSGVMNEPLMIK